MYKRNIFRVWIWLLMLCQKLGLSKCLKLSSKLDHSVNFNLDPIGNHKYKTFQLNEDPEVCLHYYVNDLRYNNEKENEFILKLEVENIIPTYTDIYRFGGSSDSNGKQSLNIEITSFPRYGSNHVPTLLRSKSKIPLGETIIRFNSGNKHSVHDDILQICLINFTFDGSWNLYDVTKAVGMEIKTQRQEQEAIDTYVSGIITPHIVESLAESNNDIIYTIHSKEYRKFIQYEAERRNFNENTYSWVLYQFLALTMAVTASNLAVLWYIWITVVRPRQ